MPYLQLDNYLRTWFRYGIRTGGLGMAYVQVSSNFNLLFSCIGQGNVNCFDISQNRLSSFIKLPFNPFYFCLMSHRRILAFILCLLSLFASAQNKWDLKRSVEYALTNNISVKQQDVQARLAELTHYQSKFGRYPIANIGTSLGLNTGRSIDRTTNQFTTESIFYTGLNFQATVDLFNFFSKQNTIAGNKYEAEASRAAVDKIKNDIALNVAAAYLQALLAVEQVNISEVQVKQTAAQLYNTRKLVDAGSIPELNAAELEAQLARDSSTLITAQGNVTRAILLLKALLNVDPGAQFEIETPAVERIPVEPISELQPEQVYQLALQNLPQQRVNNLRLQSAQKFVDAARGAMYPSVSLSANLQTNYSNLKNIPDETNAIFLAQPIGITKIGGDTVFTRGVDPRSIRFYASPFRRQFDDNLYNGIGITISVPLFNGLLARTSWKKAKLNVITYELQRDQDNLTLKQDIYTAYTDAITAFEKFNASKKSVETAQKASDFAQKRYDIGLLNTIDLITNQSNLFRAKIDVVAAQYDYVFKLKVLEFYKGQGLRLQ
jgi:outer membrane protein